MKRFICLSIVAGFLGALLPVQGTGLIIVDEAHWSHLPQPPEILPPPHPRPPFVPHRHVFAPLELRSNQVHTKINDQIAVTRIEQEFYNPNPRQLEGTFVFPVPRGAHLDKFTMDIDGKQMEAELLTANKARKIYEDIVRKCKDPALLEYADRDLFKVRIFPIEPRSRKIITLTYTQLLKSDSDLITYNLPLNTSRFSSQPVRQVSVKVELNTSRPLKSIYSPSHEVDIDRDGSRRAIIGFEAGNVVPNSDLALYFAPEKDEIGLNLLAHRTGGEDGYFLLLASPGVDVEQNKVVPKDVVFVLDTSGSMTGKKLEQAKKALEFCVENLNDNDRFEIVRFSTEAEPLFNGLYEATKQRRERATTFIRDLKPIGSTAIDEALKQALSLTPKESDEDERIFVIVFLTDGKPTIGVTDENQIVANVRKHSSGTPRIFCFGIGTDVNTHLLDKITEETRAYSQYVLPEEDLEVKVSDFFSKIKEPVLANPALKFTGDVRVSKLYPSPLPDLFKGQQLVLAGRYSGHGDSAVIIEGTINGKKRRFDHEVTFSEKESENEFIPRLWATRRVGYLLDEIRLRGENSELKDEVTELARKYGIVTPYTAYLIVEDEARRGVPMAMQSMPELRQDRLAYKMAQDSFQRINREKDGDAAVAGARMNTELRRAQVPASAVAQGNVEAARSYYPASAPVATSGGQISASPRVAATPAPNRLEQYTQNQQFVGGRNFFQNGNQWVDSLVQSNTNANPVRIQFNSPEYFTLLRDHPESHQWLALGQNVQFVLNGSVYEIHE